MKIPFYKYHGTGNDFIIVDNREGKFSAITTEQVAELCHRRFGIGSDGLILLSPDQDSAFFMDYFNSDGRRSSMCGNGGRCISMFARQLGLVNDKVYFQAVDGMHEAILNADSVKLKMGLPSGFRKLSENDYWIDTGSPHYVRFMEKDLNKLDVKKEGAAIRWSEPWSAEGTNVNFVQKNQDESWNVRSYERGVEDETWSCGTGVTAVAEVISRLFPGAPQPVRINTPGGDLNIHCQAGTEPWLEGPAVFVFSGEVEI